MPHKRKTRMQYNPKNQPTRRMQLTTSAPNVGVKSDTGANMENEMPANTTKATTGNKFAAPQFNTMVRSQAEVISLQKMRVKFASELTPRSKAAIAPKVTQKMNFSQNRAVFKDLIPINVNDSLREIERPKPSQTKFKDAGKSTISEPVLDDFLEKVEPVQLIMPEPELQMEFPLEDFDFLHAYKRVYHNKN